MIQLWKAIGVLASNDALRAACVQAVRGTGIKTIQYCLERQKQPKQEAISALDGILNDGHGLRLGVYELSEINRWLQEAQLPDMMGAYWNAVQPQTEPGTPFFEAAGMLLYDKTFRLNLIAEPAPGTLLRGKGFNVTDDEANRLKTALQTSNAMTIANDFFSLLWSGSACLGSMVYYDKYVHSNY